jgi:hypothetical protein
MVSAGRERYVMKKALVSTLVALLLALVAGPSAFAGPSAGHGPWVVCPNDSPICAEQLGPDLDLTNDGFDCMTRNGRPGYALQSSTTGTVKCWAN